MAAFQHPGRLALLMCGAIVAGFSAEAGVSSARAEDVNAIAANAVAAPAPVDFTDPAADLAPAARPAPLGVDVHANAAPRFSQITASDAGANADAAHHYEFALTAAGESVGVPLDLSIAQRASLGADEAGDIDRQGRGAELRVGSNLAQQRRRNDEREPSWYVFAASDDEAVTWNPGAGSSFSLQDRVEIGDIQAGVTYERGGMQASVAYVQREVSTYVGVRSFSENEDFAGFTLTMKR